MQSVISQLPTSLINAGAVFWAIRIYFFDYEFSDLFKGYLVFAAIANILYFAFSIVAAVKARNGRIDSIDDILDVSVNLSKTGYEELENLQTYIESKYSVSGDFSEALFF